MKECADIAITISTEHSFALWVSVALMLRGWAFVQEGRTDDGIDGLRRGMDVFTTTGAGLNRPHFLSMLAEAYGMAPEDALRQRVARAVKLIVATQNKEGGWRYEPRPIEAESPSPETPR